MEPKEEMTKTEKFCNEVAFAITEEFDELDRMDILRRILQILKDQQSCVVAERRAVAERSEKALASMTF